MHNSQVKFHLFLILIKQKFNKTEIILKKEFTDDQQYYRFINTNKILAEKNNTILMNSFSIIYQNKLPLLKTIRIESFVISS